MTVLLRTAVPRLMAANPILRQQLRRQGHRIPHPARMEKSGAPGPAWMGAIIGAGGLTGAFCVALVSRGRKSWRSRS